MKTDELIEHLAGSATPVRPLPSPAIRIMAWSAVAAASAAVGVVVFGARPGLDAALSQLQFMWPLLVAGATTIVAAGTSLVLAVPGAERSPALRASVVALVGLWALMLAVFVTLAGHGFTAVSDWPICFTRVIAIGLAPAIVLFAMLRRAAPLRITWTGALAAIAAMAAGAVAIQLICPVDDAAHGLLGHFGPVVVVGLLGAATARRVFSRI